jgi:trk system potassium uptake protein TrkA
MQKVAVLGLGQFGFSVASELSRLGAEVLAVDRNRRLIEEISPFVAQAEGFDATESQVLAARGVGKMDVAVVAIGANFEASVLITMHCKSLGVPLVAAKALNSEQEAVLHKVGADQVIKPEEDMGKRLAEHLVNRSVVNFVELPEGFSLGRFPVPEAWVGQSLAELKLLSEHRLNLIQIDRLQDFDGSQGAGGGPENRVKIPLPQGSTVLNAGDLLDLIGSDRDLVELEQRKD